MNKNCYPGVFVRTLSFSVEATPKASVRENFRKRRTRMLEFQELAVCHLGTPCLADGHLLGSCTCRIFSGLAKASRMPGRCSLPKQSTYQIYTWSCRRNRFFFCCTFLCCWSFKNIFCKGNLLCPFLRVTAKVRRPHQSIKVLLYPGDGGFLLPEHSKG